ncbi:MAG: hypothetical protein KAX05_08440, partial [Bacteroidales bacterium]|nr:hypothetical protein [Bacteroidales bacterium]
LHTSAYSGGLDFTHQWKDRTYSFSLKTYFSQIKGSEEALIRTQSSSARYFQRPDNDYVKFDSSRTSLSGYGGVLSAGKFANGHWRYAGFLSWKSPGLELNDLGFMTSADEILQVFWVGYRIWEPFSIFRNLNVNLNQWNVFDFGGNHIVTGGNINLHLQFKNYWSLSTGINPRGNGISNSMLRGGPSFLTPGGISSWLSINSDNRKKITCGTRFMGFLGYEKSVRTQQYSLNLSYRPTNALNISLNPSLSLNNRNLQYVTKRSFESDDRYLFAKIDQKTIMFSLRLNYSISPNFTIQYWGQPFISVGKYSEFKKITNPKADQYTSRFHSFTDNEISYDETDNVYNVNEGPDLNYSIDNPDFNVKEFKSNLVVRWEYVPGSTIFLVWSQGRSGYDPTGEFNLNQDMRDLYDIHPHNIFLIKLSYRFGL